MKFNDIYIHSKTFTTIHFLTTAKHFIIALQFKYHIMGDPKTKQKRKKKIEKKIIIKQNKINHP